MADKKYIIDNEKLMSEWDWEKNNEIGLNPKNITYGSNKKAWWKCNENHSWHARINHRTKGVGCPYCSNQKVLIGYNDLKSKYPEIAKEWDYELNMDKTPEDVTSGSGFRAHWICSVCGEKYTNSVVKRTTYHQGCAFCEGQRVIEGKNDLYSWCKKSSRENILEEWDYEKNSVSPQEVARHTSKKVYWKCKVCGNSWKTAVDHRTLENTECPKCKKVLHTSYPEQAIFYYVYKYFNDAKNGCKIDGYEYDIVVPSKRIAIEYDGARWHKDAMKDDKKSRACVKAGYLLFRIREKKCSDLDYKSDKVRIIYIHNDKERELTKAIILLLELLGVDQYCVDFEKNRLNILAQTKLSIRSNNLLEANPLLSKEWDYKKNYPLTPENVAANGDRKVWWICSKGHSWYASVGSRNRLSVGCPECAIESRRRKVMCVEKNEIICGIDRACNEYGISRSCMYSSLKNSGKTAGGYHWRYVE